MVYNNIIVVYVWRKPGARPVFCWAPQTIPCFFFDEFSTMIYCNHQQLYIIKIMVIINHIT